ncbi:hypothetical protein PR202_gb00034 [Eleusine coracana subsp. coracana]|uniref:F-box domain-containing protein n=1 Tax=Eleusine coracana subsp. coracana TaxID=191504 RepID=A0AAV5DT57_ELECO|nr:hypothetical protein PR202_gb00034 [Eleusine coracana subsp. coracana]
MASSSQPPPAKRQAPESTTTIRSLGDDLFCEIFVRLPSLPSLVRAALACRAFLAAVRSSPAFRRRFRALHAPPLLGFFFDYDGTETPSFTPVRRRSDPDHAAALRGADVFLTRVPIRDDAVPGWRIEECRGGCLLLLNSNTQQIAVYNPLSRALDLLPMTPDGISRGRRGKFQLRESFLICSDEAPGSFRVVSFCHDKSRVRARRPSTHRAQGSGKSSPGPRPCRHGLRLRSIGFSSEARADADGVAQWMLVDVVLLEEELIQATEGSPDDHGELKVLSILDGIVYLSTFETFIDPTVPCWYLSFCLETKKLEKLFLKKDGGQDHPYVMAWPTCLVGNNGMP